jgi:hypothetical protein
MTLTIFVATFFLAAYSVLSHHSRRPAYQKVIVKK